MHLNDMKYDQVMRNIEASIILKMLVDNVGLLFWFMEMEDKSMIRTIKSSHGPVR